MKEKISRQGTEGSKNEIINWFAKHLFALGKSLKKSMIETQRK